MLIGDGLTGNLNKDEFTQKTDSLEKEKKILIEELYAKNKAFKQLYEDKAKELITEEQFTFLNKELSQDQEKIQNRINQINSKQELIKDEDYQVKKIMLIIDKYKDFTELNTRDSTGIY